MAPIEDREFGGLERQVDIDHENVAQLFAKVDKLTDKLAGYIESHGSEHRTIAGQLSIIRIIGAVLLLAAGAIFTKLLGG